MVIKADMENKNLIASIKQDIIKLAAKKGLICKKN